MIRKPAGLFIFAMMLGMVCLACRAKESPAASVADEKLPAPPRQTDVVVKSPNDAVSESENLLLLRISAPALESAPPAERGYTGKPLPLELELQNVSDHPIEMKKLRYVHIEVLNEADKPVFLTNSMGAKWSGVQPPEILPWQEKTGALERGGVMRWRVRFDYLRFLEPLKAGSVIKVRCSTVQRGPTKSANPEDGPLRMIQSDPLEIRVLKDIPAVRPKVVLDGKWDNGMALIWRWRGCFDYYTLQIDSSGLARVVGNNIRTDRAKNLSSPFSPVQRQDFSISSDFSIFDPKVATTF